MVYKQIERQNVLRIYLYGLIFINLIIFSGCHQYTPNNKINGYKGIWFELTQRLEYGDKYSGGLGTYTAKHHPLAVYSPKVNKTFFVYGGTMHENERHLCAMVSYYDHNKKVVPQPTLVYEKQSVNDPHDNPSISIDKNGYIWIFKSGRGKNRTGIIFKSSKPYNIDSFEQIKEWEFTYPQPIWSDDNGFCLLFTRYTGRDPNAKPTKEINGGRELYCSTSADGREWSPAQLLVKGGHYQMSCMKGDRIITAFNSHPDFTFVDGRTNLYFMQSYDFGKTWQTIKGEQLTLPMESFDNPALVYDYKSENKLVYLKDIAIDDEGSPVLVYIASSHFEPGPKGTPRIWNLARWNGNSWDIHEITTSTHNYDMGSIYLEKDVWQILAPTEPGPQFWGTGGEIALWQSKDKGKQWKKIRDVTQNSTQNNSYVRRPLYAHPDFYAFWADGNADEFSKSFLYFTNIKGDSVWKLPYNMDQNYAKPILINP